LLGSWSRRGPAPAARGGGVQELGARRVPRDEPGGEGGEEQVEHLGEGGRGAHGQQTEQRRQDGGVERRVVDGGRGAGEVRVRVAEAVGEGGGESGVQPVIVEDADQGVVQREGAGGEGDARRGEPAFHFRRQSPPGGKRL